MVLACPRAARSALVVVHRRSDKRFVDRGGLSILSHAGADDPFVQRFDLVFAGAPPVPERATRIIVGIMLIALCYRRRTFSYARPIAAPVTINSSATTRRLNP